MLAEPRRWIRSKAKAMTTASAGTICSLPGTGSGRRRPSLPGRAQPGFDQFDAGHVVAADDLDRLAIEQELNTFLFRVGDLPPRARHVFFIAPISTADARRTLPDRGSIAVHSGIAAAEYDDVLAMKIDERSESFARPISRRTFATR